MMQTKKEVGPDRFKFMLEFPNKVRVYVADEQMLSKILENSGISSQVKTPSAIGSHSQSEEKNELIQPRGFQFDDYRNIDPSSNCGIRKSECNDTSSQKKIDDFQELNADYPSRCRIKEDKNSFTGNQQEVPSSVDITGYSKVICDLLQGDCYECVRFHCEQRKCISKFG
jgi:hypothetical protein